MTGVMGLTALIGAIGDVARGVVVAAVATAVAIALVFGATDDAGRRLLGPGPSTSGPPSRARSRARSRAQPRPTRGRLPGLAVGAGLALAIGTWWALVLVPAGALAVPWLLARLEPAAVRRRRLRIAADLPWTVDLIATCLRAGAPTTATIGLVAAATPGPLGGLLADGAARSRLGSSDADAWEGLCAEPVCRDLGRLLTRAGRTGAPVADQLDVLADELRRTAAWTADERARSVESRAVLPLTLCFLPAFLVVGVLPILAGTVVDLLPGL